MAAYSFLKCRTSALFVLLALTTTVAPELAQNNDTAPGVAFEEMQGRKLNFREEEYFSHGERHHEHHKCRDSFDKADIAKTRHELQPCGFPRNVSCPCDNPPYRSFSGACNNRRRAGLGAATSLYNRVLRARYADGVDEVLRRTPRGRLPAARKISATIYVDEDRKDDLYSMMLMQWGQMVAHDVGMREDITEDSGQSIDCCCGDEPTGVELRRPGGQRGRRDRRSPDDGRRGGRTSESREREEQDSACMPIWIRKDDPFYTKFHTKCINFVRSQYRVCPSGDRGGIRDKRHVSSGSSDESDDDSREENIWHKGRHPPSRKSAQQLNMVTHFLDASFVYGNSDEENQRLRVGRKGLLKWRDVWAKDDWHSSEEDSSSSSSEEDDEDREFLPLSTDSVNECNREQNVCYKSGDERVNSNPWLASMETLLLREHNRLARRLHRMHPDWLDDVLFQEARRILIAEWQLITYRDYLPKIVGRKILERMDMEICPHKRLNYSSHVNPSTLNEFSQGAFRFIHSQIDGTIELLGHGRCPKRRLRLSEHFNDPSVVEGFHNMEDIVRGLSHQAAQQSDRFVTKEMTTGFRDQVSDDIQRGRDHGLPSYNSMRDICGLRKAVDFDDFRDAIKDKNIRMLKDIYHSVNHVDLYVGGTLEEHCVDGDDEALVGPTFGCIIAEQFYRWRIGDRYFFDRKRGPGAFTEDQFRAINEVTLASILCANLDDERYMQLDPFMRISHENELKRCRDIPRLSLKPWKEYYPSDDCPSSIGPPSVVALTL